MPGDVLVTKEVEVEVYIDEIGTEDLLEELSQRGCSNASLVLTWLHQLNVPPALIEPIRVYFDQPEADLAAWTRWVAFANA